MLKKVPGKIRLLRQFRCKYVSAGEVLSARKTRAAGAILVALGARIFMMSGLEDDHDFYGRGVLGKSRAWRLGGDSSLRHQRAGALWW
jgi:hypothetical protein